ncbi:diaminopimelate epimerase [Amycolatopsis anabasis]|uniref:diaminopimelate epimerase n=1 Tax=Amycolatopsis anabasis TaxID=1840409 RepID=UPI00131B13ED|nr:diaminopimelate epimerase [Amycolatopsis anabasis]
MLDPTETTYPADYLEFRRRVVRGVRFDRLDLTIMHGDGNVIAVVDEVRSNLSDVDVDGVLAKEVCTSFRSPRVDGISFLRTTGDRVRMNYFERDGTNSQMCGNALRCSARYCVERGYLDESGFILTGDGPKWVSTVAGLTQVALGAGREFTRVADDQYFVFSGLAHLVVLTGNLDAVDVQARGAELRYDRELCLRLRHPEGLHVDFMRRDDDGIRIRTYEVGVEAETLACGTGAVGSAYVAHRIWDLPYPIRVRTPGGELTVDSGAHGLLLSGTVGYLFSGAHVGV